MTSITTLKVFLSHSSSDKREVRHLAGQLKSRGISVWLDEWEIEVGESIPAKIQQGLKDATHVAVWLTPHSISSGWVIKEWQSKIFNEISQDRVTVLPLLAADCDMPMFLADKKYADFRTSFRDGFASLMRTLSKQDVHVKHTPPKPSSAFTVSDFTSGYLKDLDGAVIPFPTVGNLNIIGSLKSLPRSGKLLRLEGMTPPVQIRSIYDHVLSVAHSADVLLNVSDFNIREHDRDELARIIAYHDITEIILGDIPQYTKLNEAKRNRARVSAQIRLSQLPNGEPERITSEFIGMFLQDSERQSLQVANAAMQSKSSVAKFAYALDKIDPIIAVWRYIHQYRHLDKFDIDEYLLRMKNFFENPRVKKIVATNANDSRMIDLVDHLQNRAYAREYFFNASLLQDGLFSFPQDVVENLIEGRKLEFTVSPYRRSGRIGKGGGGGGKSQAQSSQH